MSERIFVKPAPQPDDQPALKVRKPVNGHLAVAGEWVNRDSYWLRRLADGDVVEAEEPAPEPEPEPARKPGQTQTDQDKAGKSRPAKAE